MRAPAILLLLCACAPAGASETQRVDPFTSWYSVDFPAADGFDFPVGGPDAKGAYTDPQGTTHTGWKVDTRVGDAYPLGIHNGEDWNGKGGGNTDLGQPVTAIGHGRVLHAADFGQPWGNVVVVEHVLYENHEKRTVHSAYGHLLEIDESVHVGAVVKRGGPIGTIGRDPDGTYYAHLHLEIRADPSLSPTFWPSSHDWTVEQVKAAYLAPSEFIRARRKLFVPQDEEVLLIVDHDSDRMRRIEGGEVVETVEVGFGQAEGRKRIQGDLRTPKGMYFVVQRTRGEIGGRWGPYYGGHWIKVNYPNAHDAAWGRGEGLITAEQEAAIASKWRARELTNQKTPLGGGIGFHGWIEDWAYDGPRGLSWGCVVLRNATIAALYDHVPEGTMVVIR